MTSHLITGVLLVFVVILTSGTSSQKLCETAECKALSDQILANIQNSVNPCDDFYQYACGSWVAKNPVPKGIIKWSQLSISLEKVKHLIKDLLAEPESPSDPSAVKAAKTHYQACRDEKKLDAQGLALLLSITRENGGFPFIESSNFVPTKSWQEIHDEYNRRTGDGALYTFFLHTTNEKDVNYPIILDQPSRVTHKPLNYSNPVAETKYVNYLMDLAILFSEESGNQIKIMKLQQDAKNLYNFQKALHKIMNPDEYRKGGPLMTANEANSEINSAAKPGFDLLTALKKTFSKVKGVTINEDERVQVREMDYMKGLMQLLKETPNDVIINYIQLHFVEQFAAYTTKRMRNILSDMYDLELTNRDSLCAKGPMLRRVLSYMYINRYFNEANKTAAINLVHDIKDSLRKSILSASWLDDIAKKEATDKLDNVVEKIGYDNTFTDIDQINADYAEYNIGTNFLQNMLNYEEVDYRRKLAELRIPINWEKIRTRSFKVPKSITPAFQIRYNKLEIPAAFLSWPVFSTNLPDHANFAGAGATAAYLLGSLYDDLGWYFDGHGHVSSALHDIQAVDKEHNARLHCFVEQYVASATKEAPDHKLDLDTNQPILFETIYDSLALKTAVETYKNTIRRRSEKFINAEGLNRLKELFLAFANPYCESVAAAAVPKFLENGVRTLGKLRVNNAVSNLPIFSETFQCGENSPMNPKNKCSLF